MGNRPQLIFNENFINQFYQVLTSTRDPSAEMMIGMERQNEATQTHTRTRTDRLGGMKPVKEVNKLF